MTDNKIIYNIVAYLDSLTTSLSSEEEKANVAKAASLLESTFGISLSSPEDFKALSFYPQLLPLDNKLTKTYLDIESNISLDSNASKKFQVFYDAVKAKGYYNDENGKELDESSIEYLKRHSKLLQKFQDSMSVSTPTMAASSAPTASLDEKIKAAEEKKNLGNTAINAKDYELAVQYYTEAIDNVGSTGPNSHVYYCNRAAAYCYLKDYKEAVADCEASIKVSSDYVKAFSRLGLSQFFLGNFEESVKAYERASTLEPENESTKKSLKQALKKLEEQRQTTSSSSSVGNKAFGGTSSSGGMPDMASVMNDPNFMNMASNSSLMKDAMAKMGGSAGLEKLMKDPNMMAMAQKMMQNPAALQQAMSMLGGAGGEGLPDLAALKGLGGGGGGGKKGPFKGFDDEN